jgi:hypothetical protein
MLYLLMTVKQPISGSQHVAGVLRNAAMKAGFLL